MEGEQLFALAAKVAPLIRGGRFRFNRVLSESEGTDYKGVPFAAVLTNDQNQNERLYMRTDWHAKDRVAINGMRPDGRKGDWSAFRSTRITVAANRAPAGIAGDIMRRLLAPYRKELTEALANQSQRKRAAESLENSVHLLSLQCSKPLERYDRWRTDLEKWQFDCHLSGGTIERMYDGDWQVTLNRMPFADAIRVLAWLNSQASTKPAEEEAEA